LNPQHIVVVGAGQGGLQATISLRQAGYAGRLTLIGAEPGLPYQRPPLSKAYLKEGRAEALMLRPQSFFESKDIAYLPQTTVEGIDRGAGEIAYHGPDGGGRLPYDHLVLATGTRNLRPPIEGLGHACDLRTLADAETLRTRLGTPRRIAVIGGGFIGLEFAAVARGLGHEVAVIETAPRLMARCVSARMSEHFADLHRGMGTALHLGTPAVAVDAGGVTLGDGSHVAADFTLLAAGVVPNVELAAEAGLEVENGIRLCGRLLTSDPQISALGDCASFPDPRDGQRIRLESVQAATDHARFIAARLCKGGEDHYAALPWFWSDQADSKLQIAGYAGPGTSEEVICDGVVARFDDRGLVAVETVNNAGIHMKSRRLLSGGTPAGLDDLVQIAA
jgi:3-phenylpropionate/trans-cinnamate dioxygenase ferredoxin reductase subunit